MRKQENLTGNKYGALTVLGKDLNKKGYWFYKCECGTQRSSYYSNLKKAQSCGCIKKGLRLRSFEAMFNLLKREAARHNNPKKVDLTYEEFLEFTKIDKCYYCNGSIIWIEFDLAGKNPKYNIDRKNNDIGYTKENCVVCCARCNKAKSNHFTHEEWKQLGDVIKTWDKK